MEEAATGSTTYTKRQIYAGWHADESLLATFYSFVALTMIVYSVGACLLHRSIKKAQKAQLALFRSSTVLNSDAGSPANDGASELSRFSQERPHLLLPNKKKQQSLTHTLIDQGLNGNTIVKGTSSDQSVFQQVFTRDTGMGIDRQRKHLSQTEQLTDGSSIVNKTESEFGGSEIAAIYKVRKHNETGKLAVNSVGGKVRTQSQDQEQVRFLSNDAANMSQNRRLSSKVGALLRTTDAENLSEGQSKFQHQQKLLGVQLLKNDAVSRSGSNSRIAEQSESLSLNKVD